MLDPDGWMPGRTQAADHISSRLCPESPTRRVTCGWGDSGRLPSLGFLPRMADPRRAERSLPSEALTESITAPKIIGVVSFGRGGCTVSSIKAVRRLGRPATESTTGASGSPDIVELASGDFAIIGWDITDDVDLSSLPGVHCALGERTVRVDREVLVKAKLDIPDA